MNQSNLTTSHAVSSLCGECVLQKCSNTQPCSFVQNRTASPWLLSRLPSASLNYTDFLPFFLHRKLWWWVCMTRPKGEASAALNTNTQTLSIPLFSLSHPLVVLCADLIPLLPLDRADFKWWLVTASWLIHSPQYEFWFSSEKDSPAALHCKHWLLAAGSNQVGREYTVPMNYIKG